MFGTVTNNTRSTLFLNGSGGASNDNDPPNTNIVLFPFFYIGNAPGQDPFVLAPGQSTRLTRFATLSINPSAPVPSLTSGSVEICGGADAQACELLGRAFYSIRVATTQPTPTPEPASIILLASGLAGAVARAAGPPLEHPEYGPRLRQGRTNRAVAAASVVNRRSARPIAECTALGHMVQVMGNRGSGRYTQ